MILSFYSALLALSFSRSLALSLSRPPIRRHLDQELNMQFAYSTLFVVCCPPVACMSFLHSWHVRRHLLSPLYRCLHIRCGLHSLQVERLGPYTVPDAVSADIEAPSHPC